MTCSSLKQLGARASQPKTTVEFARSSHADPALLGRGLRRLAGKGVIAEVAGDGNSYGATELSESLSSPEGSSGVRNLAKVFNPVFRHVPEVLKSTEYKIPTDIRNDPFQQIIAKRRNKDVAMGFNIFMKFWTQFRKSWVGVFAPDDLLRKDRDADAPAVVEIGGAMGQMQSNSGADIQILLAKPFYRSYLL